MKILRSLVSGVLSQKDSPAVSFSLSPASQRGEARRGTALLLSVSLLCSAIPVIAQAPTQEKNFQAVMRDIFQSLTIALPLSLDAQKFADPANAAQVQIALKTLSQNATRLGQHGQEVSQHFAFRRQALGRDASTVQQQYERGDYRTARMTLQRLTEHCFACHSKLPSQASFNLGQRFLYDPAIANLALKDRARLAVATRQFDSALDTYETLLRSTTLSASEIDMLGAFEDYLKVAIRVRHNLPRPLDTLRVFQQRSDIPPYLRAHLESWSKALQELYHVPAANDLIAQARTMLREGQLRNRFPADRLGLVHFVMASSLLHRYVDSNTTNTGQLAEAYYLLGVAESHITRSLWITETTFFLETAIRLAPRSAHAQHAYTFLEEYMIAGFTGSAGLPLPDDVKKHLEELHRLVYGS